MLHYICGLYDQLLRGSSAGLLPAVFPVLLYNGGERWTVPGNVRELIEGSIPSRYVPSFEYYPVIERIGDLRGVKSMLSEVVDQIIERGKEEGHAEGMPKAVRRGFAKRRGRPRGGCSSRGFRLKSSLGSPVLRPLRSVSSRKIWTAVRNKTVHIAMADLPV